MPRKTTPPPTARPGGADYLRSRGLRSIQVPLTEEELRRVKAEAGVAGLPVTQYTRRKILGEKS